MGSRHAAVTEPPRAGLAATENGLSDAKRKLTEGRERVSQGVDELRGEAEGLARDTRKRARRIRKRARKRARALPGKWRIAVFLGGLATSGAALLVLARRPLTARKAAARPRGHRGIKRNQD